MVTNELDEPLVVEIEVCLGPFGTLRADELHHYKSALVAVKQSPFSENFGCYKYSTQCTQATQPILEAFVIECHGTSFGNLQICQPEKVDIFPLPPDILHHWTTLDCVDNIFCFTAAMLTKEVLCDVPFLQIQLCWKRVIACPPNEVMDFVWHI